MIVSKQDHLVGNRQLSITDAENNITFPALVQYPTSNPESLVNFGPYVMEVSVDAPISEGQFPLVIISHGNGGSNLLYRTISMHLVRAGYIVVLPEHYGNNRNNNSLENTIENLTYRPMHISLTLDHLFKNVYFANRISEESVGMIGHSMGGYTALALAGGIPLTREGLQIQVRADKRIKAMILLSPGAGWFLNNLSNVTIPILMLTAEHDSVTPKWNAEIVLNGVPDSSIVQYRMVNNAGHFSFLSPFPASMVKPGFLPSTDPVGFNRAEFHRNLSSEILDWLNLNLNY